MAAHYKRPSFTGTLQSSAPSYEMDFVDGKYTVTLTDENNVLQNFYVSSNGGVTASISGNKLTLSSSQPITGRSDDKAQPADTVYQSDNGFLLETCPVKRKQTRTW